MTRVALGLMLLVFTHSVYAYVDPGTGSILIQIAVAGILGVTFFLKTKWVVVKSLFHRFFKEKRSK